MIKLSVIISLLYILPNNVILGFDAKGSDSGEGVTEVRVGESIAARRTDTVVIFSDEPTVLGPLGRPMPQSVEDQVRQALGMPAATLRRRAAASAGEPKRDEAAFLLLAKTLDQQQRQEERRFVELRDERAKDRRFDCVRSVVQVSLVGASLVLSVYNTIRQSI